jgi:hypothetical protein
VWISFSCLSAIEVDRVHTSLPLAAIAEKSAVIVVRVRTALPDQLVDILGGILGGILVGLSWTKTPHCGR